MSQMYIVTDVTDQVQVHILADSKENAIRWYHEIYGNLNNCVIALVLPSNSEI